MKINDLSGSSKLILARQLFRVVMSAKRVTSFIAEAEISEVAHEPSDIWKKFEPTGVINIHIQLEKNK